ncbi:DNA polymerase IV [Seminibacterium arietis]|uniref:DNA polymerase IV n=1 Tax=Seminibacterium arietis TaxID=1173502 RepID=A0ABW3I8N5_9PAST
MTDKECRKIIHIDMDCFYASIEIRNNPSLQHQPVAVGGMVSHRGVLSTCNYIARQYGLRSAMPTAQAFKLCPNLVLLPVNMPLYKEVSQHIQSIFYRYTELVEAISLDEAYLDVTDCSFCYGSATWIAQAIRQAISAETGLTASAGIAPLKFLAKVASDINKPNGQFVIKPEEVTEFIQNLPLCHIPGIGKVTTQRLSQMGLHTCADVQQIEQSLLLNKFGKIGQRIWLFSQGKDNRQVQPHRKRKSVGVEITLLKNITALDKGIEIVKTLYFNLLTRIRHSCPYIPLENIRRIGIKLKFDDFKITTLEKSAVELNQENFIYLLRSIWQRSAGREIRLIGLHVHLPETTNEKQMSLF